MKIVCDNRPGCPCAFCVKVRTAPSPKELEEPAATAYIIEFCKMRDQEENAIGWKTGIFPRTPDAEFLASLT